MNFALTISSPQKTADLVTFTEEIPNGQLHFCAVHTVAPFQQIQDNLPLFPCDNIVLNIVSNNSFCVVLTKFEFLTWRISFCIKINRIKQSSALNVYFEIHGKLSLVF